MSVAGASGCRPERPDLATDWSGAMSPAPTAWPGSTSSPVRSPTWSTPGPAKRHWGDPQAIMNGVAALAAPGEFLLTGKGWRSIRQARRGSDRY